MSYKVIIDSCGELTEEMKKSGHFETASLQIDVDGHHIVDDESFDQADFLRRVKASGECPKSSCPSPERYMEEYHCDAEHVYAVTLSAELSGSYNSAVLGKNLYEEEYGEKDIYVFNSRSASVGETLIGLKIAECEEKGMSFQKVIETVESYIEEQHTYFVLETLDTLKKNGRLKGLKAVVATALNVKPVMGSTPEGSIQQLSQARGIKKGLAKMVDEVAANMKNTQEKILAISHCNCEERAKAVRDMLLERASFKDVIILDDMISSGDSVLEVASELKKRKAGKIFICATFGLFTNGLEKFDEFFAKGYLDCVVTTNLNYHTPELLKRDWYVEADMSKFIAAIINSLNHNVSLENALTPTAKIQKLIKRYNEGQM